MAALLKDLYLRDYSLSCCRLFHKRTGNEVRSLRNGGRVVSVGGVLRPAVDVAWTLYYGKLPPTKVYQLDEDVTNFDIDNLVPLLGKRMRFRPKLVEGFWTHALDPTAPFASEDACYADWSARARHAGSELVREALRMPECAPELVSRPPIPHFAKPKRPESVPGKVWAWADKRWVAVPEACHPADDLTTRGLAVLAGATSFRFDASLGRVVPQHL